MQKERLSLFQESNPATISALAAIFGSLEIFGLKSWLTA